MDFLKDDVELLAVSAAPKEPLPLLPQANGLQRSLTAIYNRLGGLLEILSVRTGVEASAVTAVWFVESGGLPFVPKRAIIRLEVHQLFDLWGKRARLVFDAHFRFGGHNHQPGHPWENQEYRTLDTGAFSAVHHNQSSEYGALTLAQVLAGDEVALNCASIGGCQLMMSSHRALGYEDASGMYEAFQSFESAQVLSFFDFCSVKAAPTPGDLLDALRNRDWANFARYYNGVGLVQSYASKIKLAADTATGMLRGRKAA